MDSRATNLSRHEPKFDPLFSSTDPARGSRQPECGHDQRASCPTRTARRRARRHRRIVPATRPRPRRALFGDVRGQAYADRRSPAVELEARACKTRPHSRRQSHAVNNHLAASRQRRDSIMTYLSQNWHIFAISRAMYHKVQSIAVSPSRRPRQQPS